MFSIEIYQKIFIFFSESWRVVFDGYHFWGQGKRVKQSFFTATLMSIGLFVVRTNNTCTTWNWSLLVLSYLKLCKFLLLRWLPSTRWAACVTSGFLIGPCVLYYMSTTWVDSIYSTAEQCIGRQSIPLGHLREVSSFPFFSFFFF